MNPFTGLTALSLNILFWCGAMQTVLVGFIWTYVPLRKMFVIFCMCFQYIQQSRLPDTKVFLNSSICDVYADDVQWWLQIFEDREKLNPDCLNVLMLDLWESLSVVYLIIKTFVKLLRHHHHHLLDNHLECCCLVSCKPLLVRLHVVLDMSVKCKDCQSIFLYLSTNPMKRLKSAHCCADPSLNSLSCLWLSAPTCIILITPHRYIVSFLKSSAIS